MSLESKDRKISQQSCILRRVRQLKSRTVTRRAGYINGKKLGTRHGVMCKMLQIVKS